VLVLLAGANGRILAATGTLTTTQRRQLTDAVSAMGGGSTNTVPGSLIGRSGSIVISVADGTGAESLRRAAGSAVTSLDSAGVVAVILPDHSDATVAAVAEGTLLGAYRFTRYRKRPQLRSVTLVTSGTVTRDQRATLRRSVVVADAVSLARDLVNTAPNDLGPPQFADFARDLFAGTDVSVKVWDDRALRRGHFGGLTAVGQGSVRGPRLVRLRYDPARADQRIALVGKGITFDSGGLSLKPPKAMETMKSDMGGAACVLATVKAVSELRLPVAVTGWLALAENMPSGTAQRPGDVITIRGGKTVEVLNTDAEGRLVLADALVEAAGESPDAIIDVATLTGAQLIALGSRVAGVMGTEELRDTVVAAGEAAGESLWPMPLPAELRSSLDSGIADIANIGERNGGMMTAALFLKEFVDDETPWTHVDIAGPAFNEAGPHGYTLKGGTGFGVRTLVEYLHSTT
jgi:leucyl aminopeptidase